MALTSGERAALWRKRQREDPAKHAQYREKERERYQKRKRTGEIKSVTELSERQKRKRRRNWRRNQRSKREKDTIILKGLQSQLSPPASPEGVPEVRNNQTGSENLNPESNKSRGRKKKNLNRSKSYRDQFKLRIELNKERRLKNKYKARYYRIVNDNANDTENEVNNEVHHIMKKKADTKSCLTHYCLLLRNLQRKYIKGNKTDRQMIKKVLFRQAILRKYRIGSYGYAMQKTGIKEVRIREKVTRYCSKQTTLKTMVVDFFERDDNSRMKGGKKATITRRKIKKQIRLLNDSIKHLHQKFLFENGKRISYSLFARMKPFNVIRATEKDRETCLCKVHENPALKINKLYSENVLKNKDMKPLLQDISCDTNHQKCMYRACDTCKGMRIKTTPESEQLNYGKIVEWKVWKSKRIEKEKKSEKGDIVKSKHNITVKDTETGTIATLVNDLQLEIERLARHEFNISHQYIQLKNLKDNCKENELILHIDFSENYLCKYQSEIQSVHFGSSKRQISIHTVMALIDGIRKVGSTIQLFEISGDDVAEHERRMPVPADIPGIPETMKLHQVVVRRKGVVSSRILSCFCADDCLCFSPITTTVQDQTGGSTNNDLPSGVEITRSDVVRPCKAAQRKNIKEVEDVNETLINRYIVVEYDGLPYPGVVIDVDDNSVEVSAMHRIGVNRFFWPLAEDRFTYEKDEIVTILEDEPELVTKRHRKLDDVVWQQICTKMSLDEQGKKHL